MNVLEQVKALENGKGVQYLLDCACKIFSSPIYVIDSFYNLIASSDVPVDEPFWNELIKMGTFDLNAMEMMAVENVVRDVSNSDNIVHLKSNKWNNRLILGRIFNGDNIWVGQTTMSENIPFDTERTAAFEMLNVKISSEIHDYDYFTKLPTAFFENTIIKLLDTTIKNTSINNPQAQIMHYGLDRYLYVAVVNVERNNILENVHQNRLLYFRSFLKTMYKSFQYAIYTDKIVILMSSKHKDFYGTSFFAPNNDLFEENSLYIGVSGSFEDVYETREYYDHALAALKNGMKSGSGERVFLFDKPGV